MTWQDVAERIVQLDLELVVRVLAETARSGELGRLEGPVLPCCRGFAKSGTLVYPSRALQGWLAKGKKLANAFVADRRPRALGVIEDAAEVHGARYLADRNGAPRWRPCGGIGHVATFSLFANKVITTGEAVWSLRTTRGSLRNLCFRADRCFLHDALGYNFRLTTM